MHFFPAGGQVMENLKRITWGTDGHGSDLDVVRELLDLFEHEILELVPGGGAPRELPCES